MRGAARRLAAVLALLAASVALPARAQVEFPPAVAEGAAPPEHRPQLPSSILFSAELGPSYRYAYRESFGAGRLGLVFGAQDASWGGGARFDLELGSTFRGLATAAVAFGPAIYSVFAPVVRLGFGISFTVLSIRRFTVNDTLQDTLVSLWIEPTFDVKRGQRAALFLGAHAEVADSFGDGTIGFLGLVSLGVRILPR